MSVPQDVDRANVSLTNAKVDATGRGQGSIGITARNLKILGGSQISAGIGQGLTADGSPRGNITLNATGTVRINHPSRVTNVVARDATGNAGDIVINALEIKIDNRATPSTFLTDPFLQAALDTGTIGTGRAGNILLSATDSIELFGQDINSEDKVISTFNFSAKQHLGGGDITLSANGSILLNNAYLNAVGGYGGNISLIGNESVSIKENSFLNAGTGSGDSKNITIISNGPVTIQRSFLGNNVGGEQLGNAGNITINGRSVSITEGTLIEAKSEKDGGNSGNIRIDATDKVEISGNDPFHRSPSDRASSFENSVLATRALEGAKGKAGDINIKAGEIYIDNQDSTPGNSETVFPALDAGSDGIGPSGNVSLSATGSITLIGQDVYSEDQVISTFSNIRGLGGGDITLNANGFISLKNAYLKAARGNGGNISVVGNTSVSITENSYLLAGTTQGNSGSITVQSNGPVTIQRSKFGNNVGLSPQAGNAGNITISGQSVFITDGSVVQASSESNGGKSGSIQINAVEKVEISGIDLFHNNRGDRASEYQYTTLTTTSQLGSRGEAGEIGVNTRTLRVSDGASLRAESEGANRGGNINANANNVELISGGRLLTTASNSGDAGNINLKVSDRIVINGSNPTDDGSASGIFASTTLSQGGNINIEVQNLLLLRQKSQISTKADNNGNGGNITINAPSGFIVAVPGENSDIIANAIGGNGGRITTNAAGIYGLENRTQLLPDEKISELNASSEFGFDGTVETNIPEIDPNSGLVNLPLVPVDTEVAQSCTAGGSQARSQFMITGRGGLPPNPGEPLSTDAVQVDLVSVDRNREAATPWGGRKGQASLKYPHSPLPTPYSPIVEARGLVIDADGNVVLTANASTVTPHSSWQTSTKCSASEPSS